MIEPSKIFALMRLNTMDLLTFISAISWPVVFFIVVLMFRKLIVQRLKSFEGFGLKVDMVEEQKN
jgi:hypothetical protein